MKTQSRGCEFRAATLANVRHSNQEADIARFDLIQQADGPTRSLLIEVYPAHSSIGLVRQPALVQDDDAVPVEGDDAIFSHGLQGSPHHLAHGAQAAGHLFL